MGSGGDRRVPIEAQSVDAPLTGSAVFLVLSVADDSAALDTVRSALADLDELAKTVAFRDLGAAFTCTVAIGARVWPGLVRRPLPTELHPFRVVQGAVHTAPSTPGDLLFHIRSDRRDLCFEFERLLLEQLGSAVSVVDETVGFRYFDARDLLGFVDGTANPVGLALPEATLVGDEDPDYAGGSYVVVQRYAHPIETWNALTTEQQEAVIGRRKADNVELDDAVEGQKSHKTLTTIVDDAGEEHDILRDNMPFGSPASGEFGTYFIGYSRQLWVIERMLERMFVGDPPGLHDRLLDFSVARTGSAFFAPSAGLLAALDDDPPAAGPAGAGDASGGVVAPGAPGTAGGSSAPDGSVTPSAPDASSGSVAPVPPGASSGSVAPVTSAGSAEAPASAGPAASAAPSASAPAPAPAPAGDSSLGLGSLRPPLPPERTTP
ncbi:peroxidase [Cnuibacter physcomitrellae]|uniref:Peroxidase n=1 Tax=Cnuibacter physcomitrellae TaxID=1619308 RepID=A0A1X9LV50_9MICO|nr:peroxidase [Cnuibacter physcomitrellae]